MSQKTLVIIPTYNERENLPALVKRLMALPAVLDILVVDDNSPDGTGKLADEIATQNPLRCCGSRCRAGSMALDWIQGPKDQP